MARKRKEAGKSPGVPAVRLSPAALRLAVLVLVTLFSLFAWSQRGLYEDGFFYLRVVDVFLHSGDLAYNPGERYETNTDFLWTLLLIPGVAAGINDILWLHLLGVAIYAAALVATFALARRLFSNWESALIALVLLGGHYSFAHFAATGFGAILQALAALCCLLALLRFGESPNPRNGAALGFALFFLALCRLDSAIFGLPLVLCATWLAWRNGKPALPGIALALGIPSVLFGGVLLWKLSYYGDILPATYYAKAATRGREDMADLFLTRGAGYVLLYWQRYFLWTLAGVAAFGAWRLFKSGEQQKRPPPRAPLLWTTPLLWTMAAMCVLSGAYMLRTGGDLYEFRFMMPQAPIMMILAVAGMRGVARHWRWAATGAAVFVSVWHWQDSGDKSGMPIVSTVNGDMLYTRGEIQTRMVFDSGIRHEFDFDKIPEVAETERNRYLYGKALRDLFGHLGDYHPDVKVVFPAGGHMAYISRVRFLERYGWTDSRIGKGGPDEVRFRAPSIGHSVLPLPKLLVRLGVNLAAVDGGHSAFAVDFSRLPEDRRVAWAYRLVDSPNNGQLPADTQLFALPLSDGLLAPFVYIVRNQTIDRILDERGIERVNVF